MQKLLWFYPFIVWFVWSRDSRRFIKRACSFVCRDKVRMTAWSTVRIPCTRLDFKHDQLMNITRNIRTLWEVCLGFKVALICYRSLVSWMYARFCVVFVNEVDIFYHNVVTYNSRMRSFVIVDGKGITTWNKDAISQQGKQTDRFMPGFFLRDYPGLSDLLRTRKQIQI